MKLISIITSDRNLNCRGTIPPPPALSLAVQPSTPTVTLYRTAGTPDVHLHNRFLQLRWKRMLWMCWQCQINQLLLCEVSDTLVNSQDLQWSKPKYFLPPRWTQPQFRRCFIVRTNHSSARTMPGLASSALQSLTLSQGAVYFQTHHMFWCHIFRSLSSVLCTHHSALTDCATAFLLFQVFELKQLKKTKKSNNYV